MKLYIRIQPQIKHSLFFLITLLFFFNLQSFAQSVSLSNTRLSLKTAFTEIEKQTNMSVDYNRGIIEVDKTVSIPTKNGSLADIMKALLKETNYTYSIKDNHIVITLKQATTTQIPARKITGTVKSLSGEPLIGVNIIEKGSGNGVITDIDGNFSLSVYENATIKLTYIGYLEQEIKVGSKNNYEVLLKEDLQILDEVVIVGYGTQRKGSVTGAVTSIANTELVKAPVSNLSKALGGKLPGLRSISRNGEPGNGAEIDIRGFGLALIIIDGVPGDMNQIDPNEIESVTVLKDASAAVYGVKAANGVILVTTKRGKIGAAKVNLSSTFSWQRPTMYPELTNAAQFVELTDEDLVNRGMTPVYGAETLAKWKEGGAGYESYDWYKSTVRNWSPQQQYNINIRGGKDDLNYFASLGYLNEEGMWRSGDLEFRRFNFRTNIDAKIKGGLSMAISVAGRKEMRDAPISTISDIIAGIQKNFPIYSPYPNNNKEYYAETNSTFNPLAYTNSDIVGYTKGNKRTFEGSASLNYDAGKYIKGLSAKIMYYYRFINNESKDFTKKYSLYRYDEATGSYVPREIQGTSKLYQGDNKEEYKSFQGSINYINTFADKHNVSGLFVFETREEFNNWFGAYREFIIDNIDELNSGSNVNKNNEGSSNELGNIGYIGRVNYDFDRRYLFEFSFRYDGSSRFPKDGRWGLFPSVSGGWRISEESFIKDKFDFLDNLKLRASWGHLGDDQRNASDRWNRFAYLTGYTFPDGGYIFGDSKITSGLRDRGLANDKLTWYTSDIYNLGLEFGFFNGLLSGEIDVFYRKRKGLIATRVATLPGTFGSGLPEENLNEDSQRGYEIMINHVNRLANGFEYSIRGNMSYTRSKSDFIDRAPSVDQYSNWRNNYNGRWSNIYWGYKAIGQFQSYEDIATSPVQDGQGNRTLNPGDIKYQDYNNDKVIDNRDERVIGRGGMPEYMFGLNLSVAWKGFDTSIFLQGAANFNIHYVGQLQIPFFNGENTLAEFTDRWRHADIYDVNSAWIPGKYPSTYSGGKTNNTKTSTFWLEDATYLRFKEIQIGYTLPLRLTRKSGIESLRFFVTGYNLITFSGVDLLDPETAATNGRYYPQQKSISFGFNLSL